MGKGFLEVVGGQAAVTLNNLVINHGAVHVTIDAHGFSPIQVGGNITLTSDNLAEIGITLDGYTPTLGEVFHLITYDPASTVQGDFTLAAANVGQWSLTHDAANHRFDATFVPEPASLALLGGGLACLLRRRRTA